MKKHRLRFKLGQHQLIDQDIAGYIASVASPTQAATIVEIGAGRGALTCRLLDAGAKHVIAVEIDSYYRIALEQLAQAYDNRITICITDARTLDIKTLGPAPRLIVGNLPYYAGTRLLLGWLDDIVHYGSGIYHNLVLMLQKEVADRLGSQPGKEDYSRLTIAANWLCDVETILNVPAQAFHPKPSVDSAVVCLRPRPTPLAPADWSVLQRVTAAAFGQRRKILKRALMPIAFQTGINIDDWLEAARIDRTARAQTLSITDFATLATILSDHERMIEHTAHQQKFQGQVGDSSDSVLLAK